MKLSILVSDIAIINEELVDFFKERVFIDKTFTDSLDKLFFGYCLTVVFVILRIVINSVLTVLGGHLNALLLSDSVGDQILQNVELTVCKSFSLPIGTLVKTEILNYKIVKRSEGVSVIFIVTLVVFVLLDVRIVEVLDLGFGVFDEYSLVEQGFPKSVLYLRVSVLFKTLLDILLVSGNNVLFFRFEFEGIGYEIVCQLGKRVFDFVNYPNVEYNVLTVELLLAVVFGEGDLKCIGLILRGLRSKSISRRSRQTCILLLRT